MSCFCFHFWKWVETSNVYVALERSSFSSLYFKQVQDAIEIHHWRHRNVGSQVLAIIFIFRVLEFIYVIISESITKAVRWEKLLGLQLTERGPDQDMQ